MLHAAGIDLDSIADRMHIRTAVQQGRIKEAISRVNDINTEVRNLIFTAVKPPSLE